MKVSLDVNCALMEAALQLSGDSNLGLHIGERTTVNVLGITGYLMESSKDVLTALQHLQQFTTSFTRLYTFSIELRNNETIYRVEPIQLWNDISPETARQSVDIGFAGTLHILRLLTGVAFHPIRALYRYPRFADTSEHKRVLKCHLEFNRPCNALIFSQQDMQRNIIGYNRALNDVFIKMLQEKLAGETQAFTQQVHSLILELSRFSFPSLEEVASGLYITPRTLQRKLQVENTSFREVIDSIKEELARNLLLCRNLTVSEVSDRLGYADQASFQRAFKLWTGTTPKTFQARQTKDA